MNARGPASALLALEGPVVDTRRGRAEAWELALGERGLELPFDRLCSLVGEGREEAVPIALGLSGQEPGARDLIRRHRQLFEEGRLPRLQPQPAARKMLERLRRDWRPVVWRPSDARLAGALAARAGVDDLVEVPDAKALGGGLSAVLKWTGAPRAQAWALGASPGDAAAAVQAGLRFVALRCGGFDDEELKSAWAIYDDPSELLDLYEELLERLFDPGAVHHSGRGC